MAYQKNHASNYKTVNHYYGSRLVCPSELQEDFSLMGSLYGGYRSYQPDDQCMCTGTTDGSITPNNAQCYPVQACASCDLNRSGQCSQSAGPSGVPGV